MKNFNFWVDYPYVGLYVKSVFVLFLCLLLVFWLHKLYLTIIYKNMSFSRNKVNE